MRSRIVIALLVVAACKGKSKSKSEDKANVPVGGGPPPPGTGSGSGAPLAVGSGSRPVEPERIGTSADKGGPDQPTKVTTTDGIQAAAPRGDTAMERRAPSAPPPAEASAGPAIPTPAAPRDRLAAAPVRAGGAMSITRETALDASTLTIDAVTATIRSTYASAIRRCAGGRSGAVSIAFTVNEAGRVAAASASDAFDAGVAACIVDEAKRFVFRVPTIPASESPAKARFAMTLLLGAP